MIVQVTAGTVRPVYKHIVVIKKARVADMLVTPEKFQLIQEQLAEVNRGERKELDPELQAFVPKGHLHKTHEAVFKGTYDRDDAEEAARYQGAIIVATVGRKVPGGNEPLPLAATTWVEQVAWEDEDPHQAFLEAVNRLQGRFQQFSDTKFVLVSPEMAANQTLVTVAYQPICAYPKRDRGFEVVMVFHQVTRYGSVDMGGHDVYSEEGFFPVSVPSKESMMLLLKTPDEIGELPGFLTGDQRAENKAMRKSQGWKPTEVEDIVIVGDKALSPSTDQG